MKKRRKYQKFFLSKKSQTNEIYHTLIQILIAVAVYWILQSYIDSISKDTLFEKAYLSKDIALLTDTIYGSPGDVNYNYINDQVRLNRFEFIFNNQKVGVSEIENKGKIIVEQPYGEDLTYPHSGQDISSSDHITFSKTNGNLDINKN